VFGWLQRYLITIISFVLILHISQWVDIIGFASEKQAAWSFSRKETDHYSWEKLDVKGETIVRNFSFDAYKTFASFLPSGMSIVLDFSYFDH
jgi:hypothetical protein